MGAWKKFLDLIGIIQDDAAGEIPDSYKQKCRWRAVPDDDTGEALLTLTKAMLTDAQEIAQGAMQYPDGGTIQQRAREDIDRLLSIVQGILEYCEGLKDTPIGINAMEDTLRLAWSQYFRVRVETALGEPGED